MRGFMQLGWLNKLGMMGGNPPNFTYQVVTTGAGQAHTPKWTFAAGAPSALMDWGDGTAQTAVTSGTELSHTYTNAGTYTATLIMPQPGRWVTQWDCSADYVKTTTANIGKLRSLTYLHCGGSGSITGPVSDLPAGLTYLNCYGGSNNITGPTSSLPAGLTYLNCSGASSITGTVSGLPAGLTYLNCSGASSITGPVSGLPAGLTYLNCQGGSNGITGPVSGLPANITQVWWSGASNAPAAGAPPSKIQEIHLENNGLSQAVVDGILTATYNARASYTYATPVMTIGGSNSAPSGTYQAAVPPTSGKEAAYDLVNDPTAEGFKKWTITFTA